MRADPELSNLIAETIDAGLLKPGTRAIEVALLVATDGQRNLSVADRLVWESAVLPILSKPIETQIAVRALEKRALRSSRKLLGALGIPVDDERLAKNLSGGGGTAAFARSSH